MDSITFISDILTTLVTGKIKLIFINTCKDHVKSSDVSLRQYIFLQIRIYSRLKHPLQAWQYEILSNKVCLFGFKKKEKSQKSKQILTCMCLIGPSEFNKRFFKMEIVHFESQEYTMFFAKKFYGKSQKSS